MRAGQLQFQTRGQTLRISLLSRFSDSGSKSEWELIIDGDTFRNSEGRLDGLTDGKLAFTTIRTGVFAVVQKNMCSRRILVFFKEYANQVDVRVYLVKRINTKV